MTTLANILTNVALSLILNKMSDYRFDFKGIMQDKTGFFLQFKH